MKPKTSNAIKKKLKALRPEIKKIEDNIIQPQVTAENELLIDVLNTHLKRPPTQEDLNKCIRSYPKGVTTEYTFVYDKTILGNVRTSITDDGVLMEFNPVVIVKPKTKKNHEDGDFSYLCGSEWCKCNQ